MTAWTSGLSCSCKAPSPAWFDTSWHLQSSSYEQMLGLDVLLAFDHPNLFLSDLAQALGDVINHTTPHLAE